MIHLAQNNIRDVPRSYFDSTTVCFWMCECLSCSYYSQKDEDELIGQIHLIPFPHTLFSLIYFPIETLSQTSPL